MQTTASSSNTHSSQPTTQIHEPGTFLASEVSTVYFSSLKPTPDLPSFPDSPSILGHIFRNEGGHFQKDTPENRAYILNAASNPSNLVGISPHGVEYYLKILPNGTQAWAYVKQGLVTNGGCNLTPNKWVEDPEDPRGGEFRPLICNVSRLDSSNFRERLEFNALIRAYNRDRPDSALQPHPLETLPERLHPMLSEMDSNPVDREDPKGVRHSSGVILDLLEELSGKKTGESLFFIPTDVESALSRDEIHQIMLEIARGIYLYDEVPFLSLHTNANMEQYPIIQPIYQGEVGYIMASIDYLLKAFFYGKIFPKDFIFAYQDNPSIGKSDLESCCIDFKAYCEKHTSKTLLTIEEIYARLGGEESSSNYILQGDSLSSAFQIVVQQDSIRRSGHLLIPSGEFQITSSSSTPFLNEDQLDLLLKQEEARRIMCDQIQELLPLLPKTKKWLNALYVINFFVYYFKTLKMAGKVPIFEDKSSHASCKTCPTLFPTMPLSDTSKIKIEVTDLYSYLSEEDRLFLDDAIINNKINEGNRKVFALLIDAFEKQSEKTNSNALSPDHFEVCAKFLLGALRRNYVVRKNEENIFLSRLGIPIKDHWEAFEKENLLFEALEKKLLQIEGDIAQAKETIEEKRQKNEPFSRFLEWQGEFEDHAQSVKEQILYLKKWFEAPITILTEDAILLFDPIKRSVNLTQENSEKSGIIFGGCHLETEDIESSEDPLAFSLLAECEETIAKISPGSSASVATEKESGILLKLPYTSLSSDISKELRQLELIGLLYEGPTDKAALFMFHAIATEDKELFLKMTEQLTNWDACDALGASFIHYAADVSDSFFLNRLIQSNKIEMRAKDPQGFTAMHYAARRGYVEHLELLEEADYALLNIQSQTGETPLHTAVQHNQIASVKFFTNYLDNAKQFNRPSKHGFSPLFCALHHGFEDIALELLATNMIDPTYRLNGENALHLAIKMKLEKATERLIELGMEVNATFKGHWKPIHLAVAVDWLQGVKLLTKQKNIDLSVIAGIKIRHREIAAFLESVVKRQASGPPAPAQSTARPISRASGASTSAGAPSIRPIQPVSKPVPPKQTSDDGCVIL